MKFGYTILYVTNVPATISFYEKAFNLQRTFIHESGSYGQLSTGATTLAFADESLASSNVGSFTKNKLGTTPAGFEIAFVTECVTTAYQHAISSGATALKAPTVKPWGQEVAYVLDCNGIIVELCSEIQ